MWHKPCRTFHPWCPCIKTRCLSWSIDGNAAVFSFPDVLCPYTWCWFTGPSRGHIPQPQALSRVCGRRYYVTWLGRAWDVWRNYLDLDWCEPCCPASRTTLVATRFRVAAICPIIQVPHCIRVFFYFVWFVFIYHIFHFYYELCTYCNILDIYLS